MFVAQRWGLQRQAVQSLQLLWVLQQAEEWQDVACAVVIFGRVTNAAVLHVDPCCSLLVEKLARQEWQEKRR